MPRKSTQKEYLKNPNLCPNCRCDKITSNPDVDLSFEEGDIKLTCHCIVCQAKWVETYKLIFYSKLKVPDPRPM